MLVYLANACILQMRVARSIDFFDLSKNVLGLHFDKKIVDVLAYGLESIDKVSSLRFDAATYSSQLLS